jgi:ABC-2 type transport system ATP-binding protein
MESILEVKGLKKHYGDFAAVKGIPFGIKEGEVFSPLGLNGAGRSITISMLSTLYTPTAGDRRGAAGARAVQRPDRT